MLGLIAFCIGWLFCGIATGKFVLDDHGEQIPSALASFLIGLAFIIWAVRRMVG